MDDFADFWLHLEGKGARAWLRKHSHYEVGEGCFPSKVSRSRLYAIVELTPVAIAIVALPLVLPPAIQAIAHG